MAKWKNRTAAPRISMYATMCHHGRQVAAIARPDIHAAPPPIRMVTRRKTPNEPSSYRSSGIEKSIVESLAGFRSTSRLAQTQWSGYDRCSIDPTSGHSRKRDRSHDPKALIFDVFG